MESRGRALAEVSQSAIPVIADAAMQVVCQLYTKLAAVCVV